MFFFDQKSRRILPTQTTVDKFAIWIKVGGVLARPCPASTDWEIVKYDR